MHGFGDFVTRAARAEVAFRKRHPKLTRRIPFDLIRLIKATEARTDKLRRYYVPIEHRCRRDNVFHLGIQKTGSMWIQSVLFDIAVYRYSGLLPERVRGVRRRRQTEPIEFAEPFTRRRIISKLYITYPNFLDIPQAGSYAAFFVVRDPRELVVSWYFSTKNSHIVKSDASRLLYRARKRLHELSEEDGLKYCIDVFADKGKFELLRTWTSPAVAENPNVRVVRFEKLAGDRSIEAFGELFEFLDVAIPPDALESLVHAYSFRTLSGRKPGTEDTGSSLRSGVARSWTRYLTDPLLAHLDDQSDGLCKRLGYE